MTTKPLLIFDVNETLLDVEVLTPHFERIFGDGSAMRQWFAQLILYSLALTLAGDYVPFEMLRSAVLKMLARVQGKELNEADIAAVEQAFQTMPPHPEVPGALKRLRDAGFRIFTLNNNTKAVTERQFEHAQIAPLFERILTIDDEVHRYKPAPESYAYAERSLGVSPSSLCLIACHTWDTLGARAAGWEAALILRKGNAPLEAGPQPTIIGADLSAIADSLIAKYGSDGGN